ncbi:hypothetical protein KSF78_0007455 [Schistosoma japonicum]|nr:hypothetical protein KSF78_0007455 [Schistosoma japonicum]KAH8861292.1 hypothetical protein KSF78_0007455 [Schistosoma japonicum]
MCSVGWLKTLNRKTNNIVVHLLSNHLNKTISSTESDQLQGLGKLDIINIETLKKLTSLKKTFKSLLSDIISVSCKTEAT